MSSMQALMAPGSNLAALRAFPLLAAPEQQLALKQQGATRLAVCLSWTLKCELSKGRHMQMGTNDAGHLR
jgi:hypothetical protein